MAEAVDAVPTTEAVTPDQAAPVAEPVIAAPKPRARDLADLIGKDRQSRKAREAAEAKAADLEAKLRELAPRLELLEKGDVREILKLRGKSLNDVLESIAGESDPEAPTVDEIATRKVEELLAKRDQAAADRAKADEEAREKAFGEHYEAKKAQVVAKLKAEIDGGADDRVSKRAAQVMGVDLYEEAVALAEKHYLETEKYLAPSEALKQVESHVRTEALRVLGLSEEQLAGLTKAVTPKSSGKAATPSLNNRNAGGVPAVSSDDDDEPPLADLEAKVRAAAKRAFKDQPDLLATLR